jgi:hypothetical protein
MSFTIIPVPSIRVLPSVFSLNRFSLGGPMGRQWFEIVKS